ncbi:hypothetical protein PROFUN_03172 [Planoprotostelium fungivorum]|uniref:DNA replication licensing factor MCM5 n=1 Tax=Planoprotostelium fungivorum TaxID=1890364 RepID=A0A2P6NWW1_9EUKA|nr:hypothetical protein PROFUN_03172 [Planoprotostelium fungivorum]
MSLDEGQIYAGVGGGAHYNADSNVSIESRFREFLRSYREGAAFIYRDRLRQNINQGYEWLNVNLQHLSAFDEGLSEDLRQKPAELLPLFSSAARDVAISGRKLDATSSNEDIGEIQIVLESNQNVIPIRGLMSNHISKLVAVSGIIVAASRKQARGTRLTIMCRGCLARKTIESKGYGSALPRTCDGAPSESVESAGGGGRCPLDPFEIVTDLSSFIDHQTLKLQEDPETIPTGEMPRQMMLSVERSLVEKAVPGTRVTALGIYTIMATHNKRTSNIQLPYMKVIGLTIEGTGRINKSFKPEEEEEFNRLSKTPDLYSLLAAAIAPAIFGHHEIKKAMLCQLFSGSRKRLPDGMRLRGDINVLLLGDPGTAKSQMLKFIEKVAPVGVYTSGKGSSAAGLTASVVKDKSSREFYLEGGAMVLADGGIVCIDEFDKMRQQDRVAIHEAMEQQTISIAKAGITTILNSRTSVLAAANPVFGRYDEMKSADENIDFQSTILSRFDLIFLVKDHMNEEADLKIANHVIRLHSQGTTQKQDSEVPLSLLKRYVSYCRSKISPRLSEPAAEVLQNHYVSIRSAVRNKANETGQNPAIPITVRQLEAIVRISESLARMTLTPMATEHHVNEAIRLFNLSTFEAATTGSIVSETMSPALLSEVNNAETLLKRRLPIGSRISEKNAVEDFVRQGVSEFAIRKAIQIMIQRSELEHRNQRKVLYRKC